MIDNLTEAISHPKEERKKIDKTLKYWESINAPLSEQVKYEIGLCKDKLTQCDQTIAWLEELQERREADRWIPVSERLPDKEGRCLVFTDYGDVTMDSFVAGMFVCNLGNVTHWKPLPKAPESEDKRHE